MKVNFFLNFFIIFLVRIQCNRCGKNQNQIMFNSNNSSNVNLQSNQNLYLKNHFLGNNFNVNKNFFENNFNYNSYSPKNKNGDEKKKKKPFIEREGDWICVKCKNLNFAFRNNCNRCGLTKNENQKLMKNCIGNNI